MKIREAMRKFVGKMVKNTDSDDNEIPEASIMVYCQNRDGHLLYESDIRPLDVL